MFERVVEVGTVLLLQPLAKHHAVENAAAAHLPGVLKKSHLNFLFFALCTTVKKFLRVGMRSI
jgi:hypothetical protein